MELTITTTKGNQMKPRRVKAKISRTVTEIAIVLLDKDGNLEEVEETMDELDWEDGEVLDIRTILTEHN